MSLVEILLAVYVAPLALVGLWLVVLWWRDRVRIRREVEQRIISDAELLSLVQWPNPDCALCVEKTLTWLENEHDWEEAP